MITLLRRLFIKNYKDVGDPVVREKHGLLAAAIGIVTNFILVLLKLSAAIYMSYQSGFAVFSVALIADAVNNLSDMGSSIVTLVSFKISLKPADKDHPFGHQRSEYVSGLIVSIIVCCLAVVLFEQSLTSAISGSEVGYDLFSIIVLAVSVLLKLFQGYVYISFAKAISSNSLKANTLDSLTDALSTFLVLVSAVISYTVGFDSLDSYMGIAVSLFILYSGAKMVKEATSPLLGEAPKKEDVEAIAGIIEEHPEILGFHDLIIHDYGPTRRFLSFHAEVEESRPIGESHEAIDDLEREIHSKLGYETTIHLDPVAVGDPLTDSLKETVRAALENVSEQLTFHDFRIVKGKGHTNVIFDVLLPFGQKGREKDIEDAVRKALDERKDGTYYPVLTFDAPFAGPID